MAMTQSTTRQTRWGPESMAFRLTGLKASITGAMTNEQKEAYALHVRIEEITQEFRFGHDLVSADLPRRPPSPDPQYDQAGQRINTRATRRHQDLERERHALIQQALRIIPHYRPPRDYKGGFQHRTAVEDKVYVPVKEFPELNFIGQLLGPRGRTLKELSSQSGAHILIRGKGSVKEGSAARGRRVRAPAYGRGARCAEDPEEPLHCLITADCRDKADAAKRLVQSVIEDTITLPEHTNERKRGQLRDLAIANGTFRDDEGRGRGLITADTTQGVTCHGCGNGGHIMRDCPDDRGKQQRASASHKHGALPPWRREQNADQGGDNIDLVCQQFLNGIGA
ncbi:Branchpoint-bridging protein [Apiospora kogelbergensis]|uniref:Branchpoint-bridging protein n=1 Tax=Apiospora kogelbergensis TaxID=1337665 RepID=A0AAW0RE78_9PEZI